MKALLKVFIFIGLFTTNAFAIHLRTGDVLLQSNDCFLCKIIEAEENSPYSHTGVVVNLDGYPYVLQALGNVNIVPLLKFLSQRTPNTQTLVVRGVNSEGLPIQINSKNLMNRFDSQFINKSYDSQFLWGNADQSGEKYYCSEFVAKFLDPFLDSPIPTKPMHFEKNRSVWMKYFRNSPPDGLPGLSPGDFELNPNFNHVGYL